MIIVNGRKFARNNKELTESLFQADGTAYGTYKVVNNRGNKGVNLYNLQGELFAFIRTFQGMILSATKLPNGKTWYSYLGSQAESYLGLDQVRFSDLNMVGHDALKTIGL